MQLGRPFGCFFSHAHHIPRAHRFDGVRQRLRFVFTGPILLIVKDQVVHRASANPHHRCPAGLAFQRNQTKCFLHAGMNEEIGGAVIAR